MHCIVRHLTQVSQGSQYGTFRINYSVFFSTVRPNDVFVKVKGVFHWRWSGQRWLRILLMFRRRRKKMTQRRYMEKNLFFCLFLFFFAPRAMLAGPVGTEGVFFHFFFDVRKRGGEKGTAHRFVRRRATSISLLFSRFIHLSRSISVFSNAESSRWVCIFLLLLLFRPASLCQGWARPVTARPLFSCRSVGH